MESFSFVYPELGESAKKHVLFPNKKKHISQALTLSMLVYPMMDVVVSIATDQKGLKAKT